MEAYNELEALFKRLYNLNHLLSLGFWDGRTMMPPKGAAARGEAMGELQQVVHDLLVTPRSRELLDTVKAHLNELGTVEQANVREMEFRYQREAALPADFVQRKVRTVTASRAAWPACKRANNFAAFLPYLERNVAIAREEAQHRAKASGEGLYESLFHMFEPGMSMETLTRAFDDVKSWLPGLLKEVMENDKDAAASIVPLQTPLPFDRQMALAKRFMQVWGFDFEAGRLDLTVHPFTGMVKEDSRITMNFNEESYKQCVLATIHETGHSKYETNCGPLEKRGQPVCEARSMTIHESQSRFAEVVIGCSAAFAEFAAPLLREHLGDQPAFTVENVRKMNQQVTCGPLRVKADEVSYPLHILIRYEIERDLIEGTMEAADVPRAWNDKMKEYLGLETLGRDDIGCLQDIHWAQANFGYFPTYSLGSMFAAQLMATIRQQLGDDVVTQCIRTGHLDPILAKQKEMIWDRGCLYETEELMQKATGERLDTKYFKEHLERRYLRHED